MQLIHKNAIESLDIRAVIFDVDGLLFDTEALYLDAWPHVGRAMDVPITREVAAETIALAAEETEVIFQAHYGERFTLEAAKPIMRAWLTEHVEKHGMPTKPGARALIEALHARGLPLAIGSSNVERNVVAYLESVGLLSYFPRISTVDKAGRAKPAPDIFLYAAKLLDIPPARCLVLDDSPVGIQAAFDAGCIPAMVPDLLQPDDAARAQAWRIFESLEDVPAVLF